MKMVRIITILLFGIFLAGCGTSTRSHSSARSLMLLEETDLPRNAKFTSPKYQQGLKKSMKKHQRDSKKRYKRAKR